MEDASYSLWEDVVHIGLVCPTCDERMPEVVASTLNTVYEIRDGETPRWAMAGASYSMSIVCPNAHTVEVIVSMIKGKLGCP